MMKETFEALKKASGTYEGEGINHEGQSFRGKFSLKPILGGRGFAINFSATGKDGTVYHQEESTVAPAMSEKLTLWNFNTNMPCILAHELRSTESRKNSAHRLVFGFNQASDAKAFREEIAIDIWDNGDLSYTYSWGMPGGEFKERSGVRMTRKP